MYFMFQLNKKHIIIAYFILFLCHISYAAAEMIVYEYKDIEFLTQQNNLSEIEHCADRGSPSCLTLLGGAYYWGLSFKDTKTEKNKIMAGNFFLKTLVSSLTARAIFAVIIEDNRPLESGALLNSAATEGYYPGINRLAHRRGLKTDKERLESIKWRKVQMTMTPSIAHDEKGFIGSIYLKMTQPDYSSALPWLHKASEEEDDMLAQHNIARLYAEGKGVDQDYVTAYMYYDLSGSAGSEEKAKLTKYMTPAQVQEGIYRSHQWQDEHHSYRPGYGAWNDTGGIEWNVH